jgi:hypothetical protein
MWAPAEREKDGKFGRPLQRLLTVRIDPPRKCVSGKLDEFVDSLDEVRRHAVIEKKLPECVGLWVLRGIVRIATERRVTEPVINPRTRRPGVP